MTESKTEKLERFKEAARRPGADESTNALDRIIRKPDLTGKPAESQITF